MTADTKKGEDAGVELTGDVETAVSQSWTAEEERRIVRKMDWNIIPWAICMYIFSFLNRVNISNARVINYDSKTGLGQFERDTGMTTNDFNTAVSVFFITYVIFEPLSNLVLNVLKPSVWMSRIMVTWGIFSACMAATQNYAGVISLRLLLGAAEAGLFPGISYYLSFWYKRSELAFRVGLFFGGASFGTAFSGVLAAGISYMEGVLGLSAWRWIFLLEGVPTIIIGILVYFFLPDFPSSARFLSEREREIASSRMKLDPATATEKVFDKKMIMKTLKNPLVWALSALNLTYFTPGYALSFFAPTILSNLGYTGIYASLYTVPPLITGAFFCLIFTKISDLVRQRIYPMMFCVLCMIAGYFTLAVSRTTTTHYGILFLSSIGTNGAIPIGIALLSNNLRSHTERSLGLGIMVGLGNIAGAIAGQIYKTEDRPWYSKGHYTLAGISCAALVILTGARIYLVRLNATHKKSVEERLLRGEVVDEGEMNMTYST